MQGVDGAHHPEHGLKVGLPDGELRHLDGRLHPVLDAVQAPPDCPDHADQGAELRHQRVVISHHLEEMVRLGAHLTGDVDLHLVNVVLELLLN